MCVLLQVVQFFEKLSTNFAGPYPMGGEGAPLENLCPHRMFLRNMQIRITSSTPLKENPIPRSPLPKCFPSPIHSDGLAMALGVCHNKDPKRVQDVTIV